MRWNFSFDGLKAPKIVHSLILLMLVFLGGCGEPTQYDFVIRDVGLFDGEEDRGTVNIGINADTIAATSKEPLSSDSVIDGTGKYIIPGLVNAHVHITSLENLKEGYEWGILANLNLHTGLEEREQSFRQVAEDSTGYPFYYGVGHAATVPGGHPTQYSPDMETINDTMSIKQWVDLRIERGAEYIKIVREGNTWLNYPASPTLDYPQIEKLIDYAHEKGYLALVHFGSTEELLQIAPFKPDGFVHMWTFKPKPPLTADDWNKIKESGAFIIPTAILADQKPPANDSVIVAWVNENLMTVEEEKEAIKRMHEEGIVIVAGTDSPNAGLNYGSDLLRELEIYSEAGLSNLEVLKTATGNAAKELNIRVGLLKEGSEANMLLLNGNPIEDLDALRQIESIWKRGVIN